MRKFSLRLYNKMEPVSNNCRPYHLGTHVHTWCYSWFSASVKTQGTPPIHGIGLYPLVIGIISILRDATKFV